MGLDNGIVLKNYKNHNIPQYILNICLFETASGNLDLCYWRKYWSLRNDIFDKVHAKDNDITNLDAEDIEAIKNILIKYVDRKYWEEGHDDCIWDYDEAKGTIINSIIVLVWLADYMKLVKEKPVEVYFYDSY